MDQRVITLKYENILAFERLASDHTHTHAHTTTYIHIIIHRYLYIIVVHHQQSKQYNDLNNFTTYISLSMQAITTHTLEPVLNLKKIK